MRVAVVADEGRREVLGRRQDAALEGHLAAASVVRALRRAGCDVLSLTVGEDGRWRSPGGRLGSTAATSLAVAVLLLASRDVVVRVPGRPGVADALAGLCELVEVPLLGASDSAAGVRLDELTAAAGRGSAGPVAVR